MKQKLHCMLSFTQKICPFITLSQVIHKRTSGNYPFVSKWIKYSYFSHIVIKLDVWCIHVQMLIFTDLNYGSFCPDSAVWFCLLNKYSIHKGTLRKVLKMHSDRGLLTTNMQTIALVNIFTRVQDQAKYQVTRGGGGC